MNPGHTRLIGRFGACARCAGVAFACFLGSLILCVAVLLFSEGDIYRIGSHLLVLFFAALTAMHIAGWAMRTHSYPAHRGQFSRGCGCVPEFRHEDGDAEHL